VEIAKASVFLHIFVRDRDGLKFEEAMTVTGLENVPDGQLVLVRLTARRVRNTVADYFLRDADRRVHKMKKSQDCMDFN
jgi:hypothetical protein